MVTDSVLSMASLNLVSLTFLLELDDLFPPSIITRSIVQVHFTNAVPSRVDITFWITSSCPQATVVLHLIDIGSHSGCLEDVVNVLRTAVCAASCQCRWTPVPATPLDGARHCCARKCRPLDSGPSDDRRSKIQSLKDFGVGSQGLRGVQSTRNPLSSSRSACCRLCPAVMDGLLKRLSVSVRCLFCKSVFGTCALGFLRKEPPQPSDKPRGLPSAPCA